MTRSTKRSTHRVAEPKKNYPMTVAAFGVLLSPLLFVVGLVLKIVVHPTGPLLALANLFAYGGGFITLGLACILIWARFSKTDTIDWSKVTLPDGFHLQPGEVDPSHLWAPDASPLREYRSAHNLLSWQYAGRDCHCVETVTPENGRNWDILVALPGWLPTLSVTTEFAELGQTRGDVAVEDEALNRIYRVDAWEKSPRAERYRHAVINPLVMETMMNRVLEWRISGRWLVYRIDSLPSEPKRVLNLVRDRTPYLARIAGDIPTFLHHDYADLRSATARER